MSVWLFRVFHQLGKLSEQMASPAQWLENEVDKIFRNPMALSLTKFSEMCGAPEFAPRYRYVAVLTNDTFPSPKGTAAWRA